jgi:hypothetical protein
MVNETTLDRTGREVWRGPTYLDALALNISIPSHDDARLKSAMDRSQTTKGKRP